MSEHKRQPTISHGRLHNQSLLGPAARYFPAAPGRYQVQVGLSPLGTDFGNGERDAQAFQLDRCWCRYRREKGRIRRASYTSHIAALPQGESLTATAARAIARRLALEHPQAFVLGETEQGARLDCRLSSESLQFDAGGHLLGSRGAGLGLEGEPRYRDALDALACQIQEDLALVAVGPDGSDELVATHVCFPSHWSPAAKLGKSFGAIHAPAPAFERIAARAAPLVKHLMTGKDFVRFVWALVPDRHLNHHPNRRTGGSWRSPAAPGLRVERQVSLPLSEAGGFLFLIRTYLYPLEALTLGQRHTLAQAVEGMSPAALEYKGLSEHREQIMARLRAR